MSIAAERYNEVQSTSYTPEQLESIPQTTKVFEPQPMDFTAHVWRQEGYMISDVCSPSRPDCQHVGIPIPTGKMLVKVNGHYDIVPEGGKPRSV